MKNSQIKAIRPNLYGLWHPLITQVPIRFRPAVLQKESAWSRDTLKSILSIWCVWYAFLIVFSDSQKATLYAIPYALIRLLTIGLSVLTILFLSKYPLSKKKLSALATIQSFLWMMSYTAFSYYPLSIRTSWITILPSSIIITTATHGRSAILIYGAFIAIGLLTFRQPINSIHIVSDILFGGVIVFAGLVIKDLWIKSIVSNLEREESERNSVENEIKMFKTLESFIPKAVRNKIENQLSKTGSISKVISQLTNPEQQHLSILYSDYRNYSKQSEDIEFIKNELIKSSSPIIEFVERYNGFVQNRGDSIIAAFIDQGPKGNLLRATLSGLLSTKGEFDRSNSKKKPDRYMIVTSGEGVFCSLGNESRQEITIAGRPANLAARIDEVTKQQEIKSLLDMSPKIILDSESYSILQPHLNTFSPYTVHLQNHGLKIRTYESERTIYLLEHSDSLVNELIRLYDQEVNTSKEAA